MTAKFAKIFAKDAKKNSNTHRQLIRLESPFFIVYI